MEKLKEYAAVCTVGSVGYSAIEVLWRGFTHWTMALTGGVGFLLLYLTDLLHDGAVDAAKMRGGQPGAHGGGIRRRVHHQQGLPGSASGTTPAGRGTCSGRFAPCTARSGFCSASPVLPLSRALRERLCQGGSGRRIETA